MVTNNVTVYQFEVGLDEVFADKVRFRVNVDFLSQMSVIKTDIWDRKNDNTKKPRRRRRRRVAGFLVLSFFLSQMSVLMTTN